MKHAFIVAVFLCIPGAGLADEPKAVCDEVADLAESVMKARQAGMSLTASLEVAKDNELIKAIAIDAYTVPRYVTGSNQVLEAQEFRTRWHLHCLQPSK